MANIPKNPIIGIVGGKGKMGRLFADFFESQGFEVIISDLKTKLTNIELAQQSDITIISVPIHATENTIKEIYKHTRKDSLLVDLTSIKAMPVKLMLKSKSEVIGLHPMFGSTNPIPGQRIIMCPGRGKKWFAWLKDLFEHNEVTIESMSAKEHDKMMTLVQGLVHFADISFAQTLRELKIKPEKFLKFASPASEVKISSAARLLAQDPDLYGAIQIYNPQNLSTFKKYQKSVEQLININIKKDQKAFAKYFHKAAKHLGTYKTRALNETTWIIDQVLKNRKKHSLSISKKKSHQKNIKVDPNQIATLGPEFTYSYFAVKQFAGESAEPYFCNEISDVFDAVASGTVKQGIIPIENSLHGTVRETLDSLINHNLKITDELYMFIHHCLVRSPNKKSLVKIPAKDLHKITSICTKSPVFAQCKDFTSKESAQADLNNLSSTTASMKHVLKERDQRVVAIGSAPAAEALGLEIIKSNIENDSSNQTRFIVISKKQASHIEGKKYKTSITFKFKKNAPGNLASVLREFSKRKIDLTSIESRPTQKTMGDYLFFLDFHGHKNAKNVKSCLQEIKKTTASLKILGSYILQ